MQPFFFSFPKFSIQCTYEKFNFSKSQKTYNDAQRILQDNPIQSILEKYGHVELAGSCAYNLMLKGDIDFQVKVDDLSWDRAKQIFDEFVCSKRFTACQFTNFWDKNVQNEAHAKKNAFPKGFYIGLRDYFGTDENWKVDIWLVAKERPDLFKEKLAKITDSQRLEILKLKNDSLENKLKIPSADIYRKVLNDA